MPSVYRLESWPGHTNYLAQAVEVGTSVFVGQTLCPWVVVAGMHILQSAAGMEVVAQSGDHLGCTCCTCLVEVAVTSDWLGKNASAWMHRLPIVPVLEQQQLAAAFVCSLPLPAVVLARQEQATCSSLTASSSAVRMVQCTSVA